MKRVLIILILIWFSLKPISSNRNGIQLSLTTKNRHQLEEFKRRVTPNIPKTSLVHAYITDDFYLYKWLNRYVFDVDITTTKFLEHLRWRRENKIDKIDDEDWSNFEEEYPIFQDTFDKEGRPVAELWFNEWDLRRGMLLGYGPKLQRWMDRMFETFVKRIHHARVVEGKNVTHALLLSDGEGVSLKQSCPQCISVLVHMGIIWEEHYPDILHYAIGINTSPAFIMILDVMKLLIKENTKKCLVYLKRQDPWREFLDARIRRSQRSERFGGSIERNE